MKITKFETNLKEMKFLKEFKTVTINKDLKDLENNLIIIYPDRKYQQFIGFGGAVTESAGFCFSKLSPALKQSFINDYFSTNGINYSLCRLPIGSCDFSLSSYSYSKKQDLSDFSIEQDMKYIIPLIKNILKINPNIKFVATPWSPPAFMKDNNKLKNGGKLLDEYKTLWADYIAKYIKKYKKQGINIDFITIQNEPNAKQIWESCTYTPEDERNMIKNYLVPAFHKNNISTKLLIWDHNKERLVYRANKIFEDSDVMNSVAGIGYHYYSGDHFENIRIFNELYPNKLIIHTEGCTGHEFLWFRKLRRQIPNAEIYAHDIIGDLNSGSNGYIDWNILLNYSGGPSHVINPCNAPIMLNKKSNNYKKTLPYYYIGHFSKFIKSGAKRIAYSKYTNDIEMTAFINPDNSIIVIILNKLKSQKHFNLCVNKKIYSDNINGHSIQTLKIVFD